MSKLISIALTASVCLAVTAAGAQVPSNQDPTFLVKPRLSFAAYPFPLEQVRLLDSPFLTAVKANAEYLLRLEPDRLLHNFRAFSGLMPKGEVYGGWEKDTIAGHTLGHYLTACSLMYAQTGDARFRKRAGYIVSELMACQNAGGDGFVAGFPRGREAFAEIRRGEIRSKGFDLNGIWVPLYNWHKLLSGLMDADRLCENRQALVVATKLADFIDGVFNDLNDEQVQKVLACEHGGINESFANLYAITGKTRYLELAERIYHKAILEPLAAQRDELAGNHANTQIPKVIGAARIYELTLSERFGSIPRFFWDTVTQHHSYVIGGNSDREYFQPPDVISTHITEQTCESCNTYNMLKLTRHLFAWSGDSRYADYYERALYNHILAHQNPETGMMCYMVPLRTGSAREYSTPFDSFWCCVGSGIENHSKYGDSIYFNDGSNGLFLNLFIPSVLSWPEKGVTIRQETRFPFKGRVRLRITASEPVPLSILVRHPAWARGDWSFQVNGEPAAPDSSDTGYFTIQRVWQDGDSLEFTVPLTLHLEAAPDNQDKVAILYGPIVMAGDLGSDQKEFDGVFPALVSENPLSQLELVDRDQLEFSTRDLVRPRDLTLRPFFALYGRRYAVYWDRFTPDQWELHEQEYAAHQSRQREIDARSVDVIHLGEMQPERDHNLQAEISWPSAYQGEKGREARSGGFFSFEARVLPDQPMDLVARYWGEERNRSFEILVDGTVIAEEFLEGEHPGQFFEVTYPIPQELSRGKNSVTIRFQPRQDKTAGPIFGCRVIRRAE